jgi:hypothetical protein
LVGEVADRVGLTSAYSGAVPWSGERAPIHDRGRLLVQTAVMLADGGRCVADMAVLRDQPNLFGEVASAATCWRTFDAIDTTVLVWGTQPSSAATIRPARTRSAPRVPSPEHRRGRPVWHRA